MRVPITNQTRTHAEAQLSPEQWRAILNAVPVIQRFPPPPGQRTLREIIETGLIGATPGFPIRIRLARADLDEVLRIARALPG